MGKKGEGSGGEGGGKWEGRGREVGGKGEGTGNGVPPCPPPLNNDLYINHIRDNPLCDLCGVVEDAIHYFFHCRRYTIERQVFNDTVVMLQPLSINLILFGNENWNLETNIVLFRAVQRYIQVTKRFNNI